MIIVQTYLYNMGKKTGYKAFGSTDCPYCSISTDIGTGEHAVPDVALCTCGKWFKYWPNGNTKKVRQSSYA